MGGTDGKGSRISWKGAGPTVLGSSGPAVTQRRELTGVSYKNVSGVLFSSELPSWVASGGRRGGGLGRQASCLCW